MAQIGLSPKLYPALLGVVIGIVLILTGDKVTGASILVTAAGSLGLGAAIPHSNVTATVPPHGPGSDAALPAKALKAIPKPLAR